MTMKVKLTKNFTGWVVADGRHFAIQNDTGTVDGYGLGELKTFIDDGVEYAVTFIATDEEGKYNYDLKSVKGE